MTDSDSGSGGSPSSVTSDPMVGRVVLDRYEILRRIGSGGMGAVYAAKQMTVDREVAVKVLRGDLMSNEHVRERFRREAEIIGNLRHPNTIQLFDYGETDDGLAVMVMELLVGTPLNERLKKEGPMTVVEAIQIGIDVSSSLAEAHDAGLVHRDLKPGNIFLVEVGGQIHAKVLDFGIARILDEEATRITSTGQVFGTPRYMSPEQGMATGEVDARSDLYSFGLILYECMVGQPPFVAQTSIQYLSAHATLPPPKLSTSLKTQIPLELEQLVDVCLVKQAPYRIQTARDVVEALKRISLGVDQKHRMDAGQISQVGTSAIADLLPKTQAPGTPPGAFLGMQQQASALGVMTEASSTVVERKRSMSAIVLAVVFAVVLLGGLAAVAMLSKEDGDVRSIAIVDVGINKLVVRVPVDTGVVVKPNPPVKPKEVLVKQKPVTAKARYKEEHRAHVKKKKSEKKRSQRKKAKKRSKPKNHALPGMGGISGPRGLVIPIDEEDDTVSTAQSCKTSVLVSGTALLSLKSCAKDCPVLLDGACAGRTPLTQTGFRKGNRSLSVICKGKLVLDEVVRLREGKTAEHSCKN